MYKVIKNWLDQIFMSEESVIFLLMMAIALVLLMTMGSVLTPIITSIVLAFVMQGMMAQLTRRGISRNIALLIAFIVFIGGFSVALLVILPLAWNQLINLIKELPAMLTQWQHMLLVLPDSYPTLFSEAQIQEVIAMVRSEIGRIGQTILTLSFSTITNVMALLVYIILVPVLVFFYLKDKSLILGWMASFLPHQRPMLNAIWIEMNDQVANYVRGKAVEILIVGVVTYAAFVILDLNYAALLALLVGLSVVIPFIGAAIVTLPVALIGYVQWGLSSDFVTLIVVYGVIQALDGNALVPLLFSEAVNLHPVAIIFAVLIFGGFWGLWGVFFAIPLATLIKAVLNAWPSDKNLTSLS
ncbi:AI-2E family transporter [bacterium]|nr:AI-2E family transporter [bacterium]